MRRELRNRSIDELRNRLASMRIARRASRASSRSMRSRAIASTSTRVDARSPVVARGFAARRSSANARASLASASAFDDDRFDAHARDANAHALVRWLADRNVDARAFASRDGCKDVDDLLAECRAGESSLATRRASDASDSASAGVEAIRRVAVLTLRVLRAEDAGRGNERCLIETSQTFPSGAARSRMRPLSEKLVPGELWEDCVFRAVREELGSCARDGEALGVEIIRDSYAFVRSERESESYPGLATVFDLHRVDARVRGLPSEDVFHTVERTARGDVRVSWAFLAHAWDQNDV